MASQEKDHLYPDPEEIKTIKQLVDALEIVEAGTRALCRRDVNLAVADEIFEYIIEELRKLNTPIALRLELAVEDRVAERRLKEAATLLAYLRGAYTYDVHSEGESVG